MTDLDALLNDFIEAYRAGREPDVLDYLDRVPAGDPREQLAQLIATWVELAAPPALDPAVVAARPRVALALAALRDEGGAWPALLPRLRAQRGMSLGELARRIVERFGFAAADAPRAEAYLEQMERGALGARSVSRRLLDVVGSALGVSGESLFEAGGGLRPAPGAGALFRAEGDPESVAATIDALSEAAFTPAPGAAMDDLDALFLGGPDATRPDA